MTLQNFEFSSLAIPSVLLLIGFLSYSSQILFLYIEPRPLSKYEAIKFNVLVASLLISYFRSCFVNPGFSNDTVKKEKAEDGLNSPYQDRGQRQYQRWCRRCERAKPPRAHHCKVCRRCIPKMDHHCPWTANCVSHVTFPHFVRFLFYAVSAMTYLEYFLYVRVLIIWENRHLPSYLGPSALQLGHVLLLVVANSFTLFMLSILLVRNIWSLVVNTTTIESWEIERHETLLRRARPFGGFLEGPDGIRVRIIKQEFPYDIGFWKNIKQGMGTWFPILWVFPLASSPSISSEIQFEVNGFEDPSLIWPPPDPDRMPRASRKPGDEKPFVYEETYSGQSSAIEAFKKRQQEDLKRWTRPDEVHRRRPFYKRYERVAKGETGINGLSDPDISASGSESGEEAWRNSEGERLRDFGVDEEVEFYDNLHAADNDDDEDDIPLGELLRRRNLTQPVASS